MSSIPQEFDPAHIEARSGQEMRMYRADAMSQDPMTSVLENNPEIYFVPPKRSSEWGQWEFKPGSYYDTTIGSKHAWWKDRNLPQPTRDIEQLRKDLLKWGYCKIENALGAGQVEVIRQRVLDQADGEKRAGIAQKTQSGQNINCCVNKGRCFEGLIEQDPDVMQGGPLVEQLVTEALGPRWICGSLIAAISVKGGVPQALHQDQGTGIDAPSPLMVNVLMPITDIDESNGGTLIIPGSHLVLSEAVRENKPIGKLPPAINLDARSGGVVIMDGRLLHGTGINHTDDPRIMMLNAVHKPWLRQQENWMLSASPDVLKRASPKLLHRMGYQATTGTQTNEGHGFGARGMVDEAIGATVDFRLAADRGDYLRVGELGPNSTPEELSAAYTLRDVVGKARSGGISAPVAIGGPKLNIPG